MKKIYKAALVEKKWQKKWQRDRLYSAKDGGKDPYYLLVELSYSSGDLHMGHWFAWTAPDVFARFKRMNGKNVLFPVGGFDSFGLPAENAAIQRGIHPQDWTLKNVERMRRQFATMGPSFDWEKEVVTSDPDYYQWTQWLFLTLFKAGLAYRAKVSSNWCPKCKTVLANEHVVAGCCWRHTDTPVVQKKVDQWLFRITRYVDKLLWPQNPKVDWPKSIIEGQNKWMGKRAGINITYPIKDTQETITCFTTRPDTNFGATFIVVAPESELIEKILAGRVKVPGKNLKEIKTYVEKAFAKTQRQRKEEGREKSGCFTGCYAVNGLNGESLPIWVSDFVLTDVGTGAVIGVPGHDIRDFEFAQKYQLPIKRVVVGPSGDTSFITRVEQVQEEEGKMINSGFLDGENIKDAIAKMTDYLVEKGMGKKVTALHLRDWSFSRQRYWGAPIPIIYCQHCFNAKDEGKLKEGVDFTQLEGEKYLIHPVPEEDLPVKLPYKVDYTPTGKAPLATAPDFVKTKCPVCRKEARRETETMDTYVDSSWYFLRYPSSNYQKGPFDPEKIKKWFPLEVYFGGAEHTLGHTLYARFITKVLNDLGYIDFDEFAKVRRHHGIILGPDGARMSKSRGNVVNPDSEVAKYGADTVRLYILFLGPHDKGGPWDRHGIEGTDRFLKKVWRLLTEKGDIILLEEKDSREVYAFLHQVIKKVTEDINGMRFNTAVSALMELTNFLTEKARGKVKRAEGKVRCAEWDEALSTLTLLLAPFAPHLAEEAWVNILGQKYSIHHAPWPKYRQDFSQDLKVELPVQVNGRLRATLILKSEESQDENKVEKLARQDLKVLKWIKDKPVKKTIFVKGVLINFVV